MEGLEKSRSPKQNEGMQVGGPTVRFYGLDVDTVGSGHHATVYDYQEVLARPIGNVSALRAKRPVHVRHALMSACRLAHSLNRKNCRVFRNGIGVCVFI
jgi:hypothetical protein